MPSADGWVPPIQEYAEVGGGGDGSVIQFPLRAVAAKDQIWPNSAGVPLLTSKIFQEMKWWAGGD